LASLFVGHAAQKSKLQNLQYDEGGNHMAETETETETCKSVYKMFMRVQILDFIYKCVIDERISF
jgi:hypothetical protein